MSDSVIVAKQLMGSLAILLGEDLCQTYIMCQSCECARARAYDDPHCEICGEAEADHW